MPAAFKLVSALPRACAASEGGPDLDTVVPSLARTPAQDCPLYAAREISVRCGRRIIPVSPVRIRASLQNPPGGQRQCAPQKPKTTSIGITFGRALC